MKKGQLYAFRYHENGKEYKEVLKYDHFYGSHFYLLDAEGVYKKVSLMRVEEMILVGDDNE